MPFAVDEFLNQGAQYGFLRRAYFFAQFPAPSCYQSSDTQWLSYLCSGGSFPGLHVFTQDERRGGYGPVKKFPMDIGAGEISLRFYADGAGQSVQFFDQWMRSIIGYCPPGTQFRGANFGEIQYESMYKVNLSLLAYNEAPGQDQVEVLNYTLYDAFPVSMSDIDMDWEADGICSFTVTFAYRVFTLQQNAVNLNGAIEYSTNFFAQLASYGFELANENSKQRLQTAMSILSGFIGVPGLGAAVTSAMNGQLNISAAVTAAKSIGNIFSGDSSSQTSGSAFSTLSGLF